MTRILYNADQLAFAVVEQACRQATTDHCKEAREWLLSDESNWLLEPLNMDVIVREWVRNGCVLARGRWEREDKKNDRDWSGYWENQREK